MKYLNLLPLIFVTFTVSAEGNIIYDKNQLIDLVQQVRDYYHHDVGSCIPKQEFGDELINEFLSIRDREVHSVFSQSDNEVEIYLERKKPRRPGLSLGVQLENGKCKEFAINEFMN